MVGMGHGSANQPFEQEARQVPAGIEDRHDMDAISIVSIDDPPWPFKQLPVGEDVHRSQLGNDPTTFRQCGKRLTTTFHSREHRESVRRILLGNELDDSSEVKSRGVCPQDLEISHPPGLSGAL